MAENDNAGLLEGISFGKPKDDLGTPPPAPAAGTPPPPPAEPAKIELIPNGTPPPVPTGDNPPPPLPGELKYSLKDFFGENSTYKTIDEVKALRLGELPAEHAKLKNQFTELDKAHRTLQDKYAVTSSPKYQSALKFAHFAEETKIDDPVIFRKIETLDPEKLDPISALVLRDVCNNPTDIENMANLKELYMRQYHLGDYAEEVEKEDGTKVKVENELDKVALRRDAVSATKYLSELKGKINSFKPEVVEDLSVKREANSKEWEPFVNTQTDPYLKQIDIPIKEVKGVKVDAAYQLTPEDMAFVKQRMLQVAKDLNLPLTKESAAQVYGIAMSDFIVSNMDKMFKVFGEKMYSNIEMVLQSRYKNFSFATEITPKKPVEESVETGPAGSVQLEDIRKRARATY